jgi:hypothetical protein
VFGGVLRTLPPYASREPTLLCWPRQSLPAPNGARPNGLPAKATPNASAPNLWRILGNLPRACIATRAKSAKAAARQWVPAGQEEQEGRLVAVG